MRLIAVGLGQCGARIADAFCALNRQAKSQRGMEIISNTFAVSADAGDLLEPLYIKTDFKHRILVGAEIYKGRGVEGSNELGAEIMRAQADEVIEAVRGNQDFFQADAVIVIAGAAGGFGSGALPVLIHHLKQRFRDKVIYAFVILPSEVEIENGTAALRNTAVCLKSVESIADAVIIVDHGIVEEEQVVGPDYQKINQGIVEPFYNLLCAGAEKRKKYIGAKLLDAGDIIQTLGGWTVIGFGKVNIPSGLVSTILRKADLSETSLGIRAMDSAMGTVMSLCQPEDAATALYLITAPSKHISVNLIKTLAEYLKRLAPNAIIRSGDYPIGRGMMEVSVVVSRLKAVEVVRQYYIQAKLMPVEPNS